MTSSKSALAAKEKTPSKPTNPVNKTITKELRAVPIEANTARKPNSSLNKEDSQLNPKVEPTSD